MPGALRREGARIRGPPNARSAGGSAFGWTRRGAPSNYDDSNRLRSIIDNVDGDTTVYAYDANGNTQSRTSSEAPAEALEFHYDARDQMTRVTRGPPGGGQEVGRYAYNADGLRTRAESPTEDAARQAVDYYYDQSSVLEERKTGTSDLISRYHYGPLGALAQDDYSAGIPKRNFYHNDGLGTPTHLTDANDPNDPDRRSFSSSPIRPRSNDAARRSFFESALRLRVRSLRI